MMQHANASNPVHTRLLQNASLIDGTGSPAQVCDVLIRDDRIAQIASHIDPKTSGANDIVNCQGLTLAPGFIDVHTHDDAQVLRDPQMLAKVSQG
ncbi:MAG: hypothetical protein EB002_02920, partial [Betaproteobacteria bacterium]|nr:hypothetical protein [Betaproteobacteria bacterium]